MAGRMEEYAEDSVIMREGIKNNKMYIVLEGSVILYMNYGKENEYVIGVRGKGKMFGEMSMLADEESMYTAVAFSDVKVAWFQYNNLDQFLNGYPGCAIDFLTNIAKNNALMRRQFSMLMEELDEISEQLSFDRDQVEKDVLKISALEPFEEDGIGFDKATYHYVGKENRR